MKILYFDCFAGISGDMTLGALMDLGVPEEYVISEIKKLIHDFDLTVERRKKNGIEANYLKINLHEHDHSHHHRSFADIKNMLNDSSLNTSVKKMSLDIFKTVAEAEATVHGVDIDNVHFHEVGALDSIIDIVGTAVCIDYLKPDCIMSGTINDGHGFVECQHGTIPVPVPAVVEIFKNRKIEASRIDIDKELVTPTGAAIVATLAKQNRLTEGYKIEKIGYGAGTRELPIPNTLRVFIYSVDPVKKDTSNITVVETNIDDTSSEILGYVMERLLKAGANDVFFTPIQMKKNRPAVKLTVLCESSMVDSMAEIIFSETSTIGIRVREEMRRCLKREIKQTETQYGSLTVKEVEFNGKLRQYAEYEDAKRLAEAAGAAIRDVMRCID